MSRSVAGPGRVWAMTGLPGYHFFGYYGIQPWDGSQRRLLCLEADFQGRAPAASDRATVGYVDCETKEYQPVARTAAWNFQQGCMLHWMPECPDSEVIFNDRLGRRFVSVLLDLETMERRVLPLPVSALSHSGRLALSLNFSRLHAKRPGYGYAGVPDAYAEKKHPAEDGVQAMDLDSGETWLVVSMQDVFGHHGIGVGTVEAELWFNHTLFNTDDTRFAFLSRFSAGGRRRSAMFTCDLDGSDLRCLIDYGLVSHFDWFEPNRILVWADIEDRGEAFYMVRDDDGEAQKIGEGVLTSDGHCSFSPDRRWLLTDTYPREDKRSMMLYDMEAGVVIPLGSFYSDPALVGEIRCDLHPRWNREGDMVCFDSTHEGSRQLYVMGLPGLTG